MSRTIRRKPSCSAIASACCATASCCRWRPPDQIYNRPADLFVASFTGASSLLGGRVLARTGEFGTVQSECGERLTAWLPADVQVGDMVTVAVRPENVRLGAYGGADGNRFIARITGNVSRERRPSMSFPCWAAVWRRSSSAPACATRSAATLSSCCLRRCAGRILLMEPPRWLVEPSGFTSCALSPYSPAARGLDPRTYRHKAARQR